MLQVRRILFGGTICGLFIIVTATPFLLAAQAAGNPACGGNSTVDILGAKTAKESRKFLAEIQSAVQAGDREKIADMINYPLVVVRSGKRSRIRSKAGFLVQYDRIFTAPVREAILSQSAQCLFGNYQGAMVGRGEVWFSEQAGGEMKIITVNESSSGR